MFNALEDSNNRDNLVKSINAFKNHNYLDVPIVVFSDNHNIDIYPCGKDGDKSKQTSMHILGNIRYPFNSIKSAFQDVNTRISIDNLPMRSKNSSHKYIKAINIDGNILPLSEYQNTIIGGFGTGKSFLLDMILNGKYNVKDCYKDLANKYESFTIVFSDDTPRESLSELDREVKIIKFDQYKDIYFKNILLDSDKIELERNLHVEFPELPVIEPNYESEFKNCFNLLKENCDNTSAITDIINYDAINRRNEKSYSFKTENLSKIYEYPDYLDHFIHNLESEIERKVLDRYIYSGEEKQIILSSKHIILDKNNSYMSFSEDMENIFNKVEGKITDINRQADQGNTKISSNVQILDNVMDDIRNYRSLLEDLKNKSNGFEERYSEERYFELKNLKEEKMLYGFKFTAQYRASEEYLDYKTDIIKHDLRKENLFHSIIYTLNSNGAFKQNQTFDQRIDHYSKTFYNNFETVCYDIYENDISIMKKSAGEKANAIINIIFNVIKEYSLNGISSVVILDQPEDNLDNKGIQKKVVDRIRNMKAINCLPQLICVTHNANISITADSENIILARKVDGKCEYKGSGIEDIDFVEEVCMIVEGGQDALKKRGTKFNLPMIKDLERGI